MAPRVVTCWALVVGSFLLGEVAPGDGEGALVGLGDLSATGPCSTVISSHCGGIEAGAGRLATCVNALVPRTFADIGPLLRQGTPSIPKDCRNEAKAILVAMSKDPVSLNPALRAACSDDRQRLCQANGGGIKTLRCLKKRRAELTQDCTEALFAEEVTESEDLSYDAEVADACRRDLNLYCGAVAGPKRRTCLEAQRAALDPSCRAALFQSEVDRSQDVRLQAPVQQACRVELEQFCGVESWGHARKVACLWEHTGKLAFGSECRAEVLKLTERQEQDYRLDYRLRTFCERDIIESCAEEKATADKASDASGAVIACLKREYGQGNVKRQDCAGEVRRVVKIQAEQWLADHKLHEACAVDAAALCSESETDVHGCLRAHILDVSEACQEAEFSQMVAESYDITTKPLVMTRCRSAISHWCSDVRPGEGRTMECLSDHFDDPSMAPACREALRSERALADLDYRLRVGVSRACVTDIAALCLAQSSASAAAAKNPFEGADGSGVVDCLARQRSKIRNMDCKSQVRAVIKERADDWRVGVAMRGACEADVRKFCGDIPAGGGRVHACLQSHVDDLSKTCRRTEFSLVQLEMEEVELNPAVLRACNSLLLTDCRGVEDSHGAKFRCLEDHKAADKTEPACRDAIQRLQELRSRDWRLSPDIASNCEHDTNRLCSLEKTMAEASEFSGVVLNCLIDHRGDIESSDCRTSLKRAQAARAEDVRNDPVVSKACKSDIATWCPKVEPGKGRVHQCLADHLKELSQDCQAEEFKMQIMKSEDVSFNPDLKSLCAAPLEKLCGREEGPAALTCLIDNVADPSLTTACRSRIETEAQKQAKNIQFRPLLLSACKQDLEDMVKDGRCQDDVWSLTEGAGIDCLTKRRHEVRSKQCKNSIAVVLRDQSKDARLKPQLMKVCQQDISTHCKGVFREEADVHECLRHRLNDLSPQCLALEKETLEAEAEDLSRSVLVMKHCKPPMARYCSESFGKGGSASPATASPEAQLSEGSKIEGNSDTLTCLVAQAELLGLSLTGDKPGRTGEQDPHTGADRSTLRGTSGAITGANSDAAGQTGSASGSDHSFSGKCLEELGHLRPFVDEALLRAVLERERSATEKVTLVSSQPNPGVSAKQIAKIVSRSHEQGSSFFEVRGPLAVVAMASLVGVVIYGAYRVIYRRKLLFKGYTVVVPKE